MRVLKLDAVTYAVIEDFKVKLSKTPIAEKILGNELRRRAKRVNPDLRCLSPKTILELLGHATIMMTMR